MKMLQTGWLFKEGYPVTFMSKYKNHNDLFPPIETIF